MARMHKPRAGSGVGIVSVSCGIDWLQKLRKYEIRASDAFKRGVKFSIDEREGRRTADNFEQDIEKLDKIIAGMNVQMTKLEHENEVLKAELLKK